MSKVKRKELIEREYGSTTHAVNCVEHMRLDFRERPETCTLCLYDLRNQLSLAIGVNKWLNDWKKDAIKVLSKKK